MNNTAFVVAGWTAVFGTISVYAAVLIRRGRALSLRVPADRRRWSTTPNDRPGA